MSYLNVTNALCNVLNLNLNLNLKISDNTQTFTGYFSFIVLVVMCRDLAAYLKLRRNLMCKEKRIVSILM